MLHRSATPVRFTVFAMLERGEVAPETVLDAAAESIAQVNVAG